MHIDIQDNNSHIIAIPRGKSIDASVADEFKKKMLDIVNSKSPFIVLDVRDVSFIDSTGLGALISVYKAIDKDQTLVLCNISEGIQSIFKMTKLDQFFTLFSSKESAFKTLKIDQ